MKSLTKNEKVKNSDLFFFRRVQLFSFFQKWIKFNRGACQRIKTQKIILLLYGRDFRKLKIFSVSQRLMILFFKRFNIRNITLGKSGPLFGISFHFQGEIL